MAIRGLTGVVSGIATSDEADLSCCFGPQSGAEWKIDVGNTGAGIGDVVYGRINAVTIFTQSIPATGLVCRVYAADEVRETTVSLQIKNRHFACSLFCYVAVKEIDIRDSAPVRTPVKDRGLSEWI